MSLLGESKFGSYMPVFMIGAIGLASVLIAAAVPKPAVEVKLAAELGEGCVQSTKVIGDVVCAHVLDLEP